MQVLWEILDRLLAFFCSLCDLRDKVRGRLISGDADRKREGRDK